MILAFGVAVYVGRTSQLHACHACIVHVCTALSVYVFIVIHIQCHIHDVVPVAIVVVATLYSISAWFLSCFHCCCLT